MGFAHVEFVSSQDAVEAIKKHETCPLEIEGRAVRLDYERPRKSKSSPPRRAVKGDCEPSPTLFVGNLPYAATTRDVFETLEHIGKVVDVRIGLLHHRTSQLNRVLNLGSYRTHLERGFEGIRTCGL